VLELLLRATLFLEQFQYLAERFLAGFAPDGSIPAVLSRGARDALLAHEWPGNVRELRNRIQRATLVCRDGTIEAEDLGIGRSARPAQRTDEAVDAAPKEYDPERVAIEEALVRASGVVSKAAAELGVSRQALYRRMERLNITLERRPRP